MTFKDDLDQRRTEIGQAVRQAAREWADAMLSHKLAPPDAGFATRLRALAEAAEHEAEAWSAAHEHGLLWRPIPGAENAEPPYELRAGTGRRGPADVWARFDVAVQRLNRAITDSDAAEVAAAFGELSQITGRLAEAVEREDEQARRTSAGSRRSRGAA